MARTIVLSTAAGRALLAAPEAEKPRVVAALHRYAESGQGAVVSVVGSGRRYLRAGRYRALVFQTEMAVTVDELVVIASVLD